MSISTYIHFHIGIGWTGVAFGAMAMALRVPDFFALMNRLPTKVVAVIRFLHGIFGGMFLLCCLFMPITANWIWPRYGTPTEIIYLIVSMYVSIVLGILSIRLYRFLSVEEEVKERADANSELGAEVPIAHTNEETPLQESTTTPIRPRRCLLLLCLKYAHAIFMVYSWVMLLGAGMAFLSNARVNGFPYPPGVITDSLVGRCYGRDLVSPETPGWLANLTCGFGVMCADTS
ncbi:hypothetical protein HJC23_010846 [Cyclotella cryptica]|uniref:Cytochrome b561 domain-containing protein n=1 Tax=Cyclotella cryptica TaxID=29204 RepID=A0ABD3QNY9_9STRA|eukprot:CCRYP_003594-RA/>CCRYP_003594-RA protein AED:0.03 eAED:0.03 QI:366/1/1/1/0/0/2/643/231